MGLFFIVALVSQILDSGGIDVAYFIDDEGVGSISDFTLFGTGNIFLSRGLQAKYRVSSGHHATRDLRLIRWKDIRGIKLDRERTTIMIRGKYPFMVVDLVCTEENLENAIEAIRAGALAAGTECYVNF